MLSTLPAFSHLASKDPFLPYCKIVCNSTISLIVQGWGEKLTEIELESLFPSQIAS